MTWTYELGSEPEVNEEYPTDPVDWECQLNGPGEVIYLTFTGFENNDAIRPWKRADVEARLIAMVEGLNGIGNMLLPAGDNHDGD